MDQKTYTKFVTWLQIKWFKMLNLWLTEGIQKRDFIYIDDVVDVYILMLGKSQEFSSIHLEFDVVETGNQIELKEFYI